MRALNAPRAAVVQFEVLWGDRRLDVTHLPPGAEHRLDALAGEAARLGLTVRSRTVDAPARARGDGDRDFTFFKIAAISALAALALVTMFQGAWLGEGSDGDGLFDGRTNIVKWVVQPEPPKVLVNKTLEDLSPDAPVRVRAPAEAAARAAPRTREERTREVSSTLLTLFGGGAQSTVFSSVGLGAPLNDAVDGLKVAGPAEAAGLGGLGSRSRGPVGPQGLGIGGVGTRDRPAGPVGFALDGTGKRPVEVRPCGSTCRQEFGDGLPRDVVSKVISRHLSEVRYCYERQLQSNGALGGKVAVRFVIGPEGAVAEAAVAESTLGDADVEACIIGRVRSWRFPEPKGGGVVAVTYPWVFSQAGSD